MNDEHEQTGLPAVRAATSVPTQTVGTDHPVHSSLISIPYPSSHQHHHQPLRPVYAEGQNLLDVGGAAGTGDDHQFAPHRRIGHAGGNAAQAAGKCSANCSTRAITTHAGGK